MMVVIMLVTMVVIVVIAMIIVVIVVLIVVVIVVIVVAIVVVIVVIMVIMVVMVVTEGHLNNCGCSQSRAAGGPNLILNFPPRCSNAVNSGVAIRGQRADQGNIKLDLITNSKVPIPSHPSLEGGGCQTKPNYVSHSPNHNKKQPTADESLNWFPLFICSLHSHLRKIEPGQDA